MLNQTMSSMKSPLTSSDSGDLSDQDSNCPDPIEIRRSKHTRKVKKKKIKISGVGGGSKKR